MAKLRGTCGRDEETSGQVGPLFSRSTRPPAAKHPREEQRRVAGAIVRARRGDGDALGYLYRQYAPGVFSYVRRIVRNDYDAQDVTQQVFLKLTTSLDKYDSARADFAAWVLRMAHNAAVDHLRKNRPTLMSDLATNSPEVVDPDPDSGRSLRETFKTLSRAQRDVLLLRDVVGLTPTEVAKRLGKSKAAVNTCHHRARLSAVRSLTAMGSTPAIRSTPARRAA